MAVAVPKRHFRRAVDRNLLKRRMRETYRIQKPGLLRELEQHQVRIDLMVLYTAREIQPFRQIERAMKKSLEVILEQVLSG